MHFYEFISSQLKKGQDKYIQQVIDLIKNDSSFPKDNSDPTALAIHLYLTLNEEQTSAFQKLLMIYKTITPNHKFPKRTIAREDMFLSALNLIVNLQNNDSNYKYHSR